MISDDLCYEDFEHTHDLLQFPIMKKHRELSREIVVAIPLSLDDQSNVQKDHLNNLVRFYHSEVVPHLAGGSLLTSNS